MLYSSDKIIGSPYDNQTMFDLAAQDSLGWYWPGRHDYYLYNSPPRVSDVPCESHCKPIRRNPNFMKPMNLFSQPSAEETGQGLHPHIYYQPDEWGPELELYPDEFIPNLSSVNVTPRIRHTLPNGGSEAGNYGAPRHVLLSPNIAFSLGHFGVNHDSYCSGRTGGVCKTLEYRVEDPETGAVFMQRGLIREYYGMGINAEGKGWPSLGFAGEATLSFVEWTDVYGPLNWVDLGTEGDCLDPNGLDGLCYAPESVKLRDDPIGEGGTCTLTIGTCNYCPAPCLGSFVDVIDIPESDCNSDNYNGTGHSWTANVLEGETQTSCDEHAYGDFFTSYGNPNFLLCNGAPCEFKLHNLNITREWSTSDGNVTPVNYSIVDEFKLPHFLPRISFGADPLKDVIESLPAFIVDQDQRVYTAPIKTIDSISGDLTDEAITIDNPFGSSYSGGGDLELTPEANQILTDNTGATFDFYATMYNGDSSSPYFLQLPDPDLHNRPIYLGSYSGGNYFANQIHETYGLLSSYSRTMLADGSEKSYYDDVYGDDGIESRTLSRSYLGVPDCDFGQYPPCFYDLNVNEEYADSFIDVDEYVDLGIDRFVSVNNIDENTTLIYTAPTPDNIGDSVIHKITHEDPSQPNVTTNIFTRSHLTDVIDNTDFDVRQFGVKPATPQKIGNYVFVGSAAANVLQHVDHGPVLVTDSGKVVILNAEDLSEPVDDGFEIPKGITGEEVNNEFFGFELASNSKELFVSRSSHKREDITDVSPKVYVYEPIENDDGILTSVPLRQTITQSSHTTNDGFGYSIDANDNWLVIGAPGRGFYFNDHDTGQVKPSIPGKVYIYKKNTETLQWDLNTTIDSSTQINNEVLDENSLFGFSVSISDNYVAIGCPRDTEFVDGTNPFTFGSVFIYSLDSSESWTFNQKVDFSDIDPEAFQNIDLLDALRILKFGHKVDLSNNSLLVSAPGMNSEHLILNDGAGIAMLFSIDGNDFVPKDLFDGLAFSAEGMGDFISLYEKVTMNDSTQTSKRVITLAKTKRFAEFDHETVYILKTTDETDVNEPPGDDADQDGDYSGYGGSPDDRVLSGRAVIQDSKVWQDYSYLLDVATPGSTGTTADGPTVILVDEYEKPLLDFMHPLGLQFFGNVRLDDVLGGVIPEDDVQSLETAVIGHYMPYTFNTIQNLRYNENLADLYPEGYNPQATGEGSNGNTFALPAENSPGGTTHSNRGFPYGKSGASFAQGDGYTSADVLGYPYWMIFNHPNLWATGITGPSGSPEQSSYATAGAVSFGNVTIQDIVTINIDINKVKANAPGALLQSPNIGPAGRTGNTLLYGLPDGPTGGIQY